MNYFANNKVIFWILVILIVVNIAALSSFFLFRSRQAAETRAMPPEGRGTGFGKMLGLTEEQRAAVKVINDRYHEEAAPLAGKIKEMRGSIFSELDRDQPDTNYADSLTRKITLLQQQIQQANIRQYLALKKVCDAEQARRLSALYRDLYGFQQQKGMQHRYRFGRGQH